MILEYNVEIKTHHERYHERVTKTVTKDFTAYTSLTLNDLAENYEISETLSSSMRAVGLYLQKLPVYIDYKLDGSILNNLEKLSKCTRISPRTYVHNNIISSVALFTPNLQTCPYTKHPLLNAVVLPDTEPDYEFVFTFENILELKTTPKKSYIMTEVDFSGLDGFKKTVILNNLNLLNIDIEPGALILYPNIKTKVTSNFKLLYKDFHLSDSFIVQKNNHCTFTTVDYPVDNFCKLSQDSLDGTSYSLYLTNLDTLEYYKVAEILPKSSEYPFVSDTELQTLLNSNLENRKRYMVMPDRVAVSLNVVSLQPTQEQSLFIKNNSYVDNAPQKYVYDY